MNRLGRITADDLLKTTVEGLLRTTPKGDRMESTLVTSSLARHIGERPSGSKAMCWPASRRNWKSTVCITDP
jgi:hypothetical protein